MALNLDPVLNFADVEVSTLYDDSATEIVLSAGEGAKLPDPATDGAFNLVWWNWSDYPNPAWDPNREIVRVSARSTNTLTLSGRAQEGTSATTKNEAGKTYRMALAFTKKSYDDIDNHLHDDRYYTESEIDSLLANSSEWDDAYTHISNTSNPHSVTKSQVGLSVVENTALSTWGGTANIITVGDIIANRTALTSGLASTDELLVSDAGAIKKMDVSVLETYMQNNLTFSYSHNHDDRYYTETEIDSLIGNYYTQTNLQTSGQASVHWDNITNEPTFLTGNQTITLSGDASGSGTTSIVVTVANDSHTHDTRYYTETEVDNIVADYLPLTGGTVTNNMSVSADKAGTLQFELTNSDTDTSSDVRFYFGTPAGTMTLITGNASNSTPQFRGHKWFTFNNSLYFSNTGLTEILSLNSSTLVAHFYGAITTDSTIDGVDLASFKSSYDSHNHDSRYYTETEIDAFNFLTGNQTITLTGDVSGSGTTSITVTVADDSHNHIISNVDGLQTALDGKSDTSHNHSGTYIEGISAGALIDVSGTTTISVAVDLSELTDMTATILGTDELVVLDAGAQRRKALNEIPLSAFNNDAGFITSETDSQTLSWNGSTGEISISGGNTVDIDGRYLQSNQTITLTGDVTGSGTTSITTTVANDSHTHDTRYYTESEIDTMLSGYLTGNQTITLSGDVSGSGTTSISVTIADDSHNHVISNVDNLQTELDSKYESGDNASFGTLSASGTTTLSANAFFNSGIVIGGSGTGQRMGVNDDTIEIYGGTSSYLISVQDGNGRIQHKWNATQGTSETYLVSSEPALKWDMDTTQPTTDLWRIFYADAGTAGNTISWSTILAIGTTIFQWNGDDVVVEDGSTTWGIDISGNSATASAWATGRTISLTGDVTGTSASWTGSGNISITTAVANDSHTHDTRYYTESEIDSMLSGYLTGNQTITLSGDVSGSGTTSISVTVADDSHNHVISNVDGLQTALDSKYESGDSPTFNVVLANELRTSNGNYLIINAGESNGYATSQTGENIYLNAESGLEINSSPDNWTSGWAGRNTVTICNTTGASIFNDITVNGAITVTGLVDGVDIASFKSSYDSHNHDSRYYTQTELSTSGQSSVHWNNITNEPSFLTGNQTITLSGDVSGSGTTSISVTVADDSHNHIISNVDGLQTALDGKSSTSHNHTLDGLSNTTITSNSSGEILKWNGSAWINNTLAEAGIQPAGSYLTGNQTITLSGDVSGSGTTSIVVTVANDSHTHMFSNLTSKPTTLSGYGITDAVSDSELASWSGTSNIITVGNIISNNGTALTSGLVSTDELLVNDGGTIKRMDVSVIQSYLQSNLSFLTGNQTITLSGDASGSGTTSISVTVANDSHTHDTRYYTESEVDSLIGSFITSSAITYENLNSNGDVGNGASQLAVGNHTHKFMYSHNYTVPNAVDGDLVDFAIPVMAGTTVKITEVRHWTSAGTCTIAITKNGTGLTGFTGISVSTTKSSTDAADQTLADNDYIGCTVSSASSLGNLTVSIYFEITVAVY